jgi:hypothetical protein
MQIPFALMELDGTQDIRKQFSARLLHTCDMAVMLDAGVLEFSNHFLDSLQKSIHKT